MNIGIRKHKCEVPSVAMGDIAFNLLIFFVILAKAQDDSHLQWIPAATPKVESAGFAKVSVMIDSQNDLYLNGQQIGLQQLSGRIKDLLGDAPLGDRTVLFKVHKDAQALKWEPVIESISEAGGELVHVLEEKR